jgi:hypothetical protein
MTIGAALATGDPLLWEGDAICINIINTVTQTLGHLWRFHRGHQKLGRQEAPIITRVSRRRRKTRKLFWTIPLRSSVLLRFFFNRTPGPPPISSMNSMPAASPGPKQAGLAEHCGIAGNPANRKR